MKEIDFDPTKHTLATSADVFRIYRELWGFAPIKERNTDGNIHSVSGNHHSGEASPEQGVGTMNGWVPELTRLEKLQNEKVAINDILSDDPKNQYWLDRLSAVEAQLEAERGHELFRSDAEDDMTDYNDQKRTQEEARM